MKSRLLCLFLAGLCSVAHAQALWRGVPAGASPAEVGQRIEEATPARPSTLSEEPRALLEIPRFEIADTDFAVRFLFERERLVNVVLRADTASPGDAQALADRIYASLRSRYGLELSGKSRGVPLSSPLDRRWLFRRTTVHLQVVDERSVLLTYGVQPPRRSSEL